MDQAWYDGMFEAGLALQESARHALRYDAILSRLPADVSSILDAGCGDGGLLERLHRRGRVVGIDFSISALRRARGLVACARLDALCFPDRAFDLVVAGEVLEHLPDGVLERAAREMARVARRYCIVSVPNRERLRFGRVVCPSCSRSFHVHGHLQSFDPGRLAALLPGFEAREIAEAGDRRNDFPGWAVRTLRALRGEPALPAGVRCPLCGHLRDGAFQLAPRAPARSRRLLSFLAVRRPAWLVATYVRTGDDPGA